MNASYEQGTTWIKFAKNGLVALRKYRMNHRK